MPVENGEIARQFEMLADLLEIVDENPFRIRAYREAASIVRGHPEPLRELIARGEDPAQLSGIGKASAAKIAEMVETGRLASLPKAIDLVGGGIARLVSVPGLGQKRLRTLREELGSGEIQAIQEAARSGRLLEIPGFGAGLVEKIVAALQDEGASP